MWFIGRKEAKEVNQKYSYKKGGRTDLGSVPVCDGQNYITITQVTWKS